MTYEKAKEYLNKMMKELVDVAVEGTRIAIKEHNIPVTEESVTLVAKGSAISLLADIVYSILRYGHTFINKVVEKAKKQIPEKGEQQC